MRGLYEEKGNKGLLLTAGSLEPLHSGHWAET